MLEKKEWFSEWFDSPYYHILYQNRDEKEAEYLLSNLVRHLQLKPKEKIIDLACGKGRHSVFLNQMGMDVTGVDLSPRSIHDARKSENEFLHFGVQDLRKLDLPGKFNVAINLFTSIGYFQSKEEDELVIRNISNCLLPAGILVIDFMNSEKVINNLIERESKTIGNIQFHIDKWHDKDFIYKRINVKENENEFEFTEKVQALTPEDFDSILAGNKFRIEALFGNYNLEPFKRGKSERLIIIARKYD